MNCQQVHKHFSSYLDGSLDPAHTESMREHLAACEPCRSEWQSFQNTLSHLHTLPSVEPSSTFDRTLRQKLREAANETPRRQWNWWLFQHRLLIPSFAALLLVASIGGYWSYRSQELAPNASVMSSPSLTLRSTLPNSFQEMEERGQETSQQYLMSSVSPWPSNDTSYLLHTVSYDDRSVLIDF